MKELVKKNILGVDVTDASRKEILEYVFDFLKNGNNSMYIVTPNPEIVMHSRKHPQFKEILNQAGVSLCDGAGLLMAGKLLGKPLKERIPGTDFMEELCKDSVKNAVTVGFLGGRNDVAERAAECLVKKYPGLRVVFISEEWDENGFKIQDIRFKNENEKLMNHESRIMNPKSMDILFVAFGFPKQEEWMAEHNGKVPVRVMMGVGGAFDYISGEVGRAPKPLRSVGLEWLYRLVRQPWRIKRQLVLPQFMLLVLKEKFQKSTN